MKKRFVVLLVCMVMAATSGLASAQMGRQMGSGMMGGGMMGPMGMGKGMMGDHPFWLNFSSLGLDSKQQAAISGIWNREMKEMVRKRAEMQLAAIDLNDLLNADPVDMKAVESTLRKMEGSRTAMQLSHIKARQEIISLLTPEQRQRLGSLMPMRPMMRNMRGWGMGRMPWMMRGMGCGPCGMSGMMGGMGYMTDGDDMDGQDGDMMMEPAPQSSSPEMGEEMMESHH